MKLSEGFPETEKASFIEKLEQFRDIIVPKKDDFAALKVTFEQLRPRIVKLLKKKRRKTAKSKQVSSLSSRSTSTHKRMPHTEGVNVSMNSPCALQYRKMFLTPPKETSIPKNTGGVNSNDAQLLGKRPFRCEFERELELFMPSKFFVVTNNFYKKRLLVKKTVN